MTDCFAKYEKKTFYVMVGPGCRRGLKRDVSALFNLGFQREQEHVSALGEGKQLCKMDGYVVCMQCEM